MENQAPGMAWDGMRTSKPRLSHSGAPLSASALEGESARLSHKCFVEINLFTLEKHPEPRGKREEPPEEINNFVVNRGFGWCTANKACSTHWMGRIKENIE